MGSGYYAYTVLGVKAQDYIKSSIFAIQLPETLGGKKIYDENSKLLMREKKFDYLTFNGINFSYSFLYFNQQRANKLEPPIPIHEKTLSSYLEQFNLKWISYDYQFVCPSDVIGLVINEFEEGGLEHNQIASLWEKAQLALSKVHITEYPKLYTGFYHSY